MIAALQAGYAGTKAALDIAKGILSFKTEVERNQAVIDIQRHVLDTQCALGDAEREYTASLKRIDTLEAEIARLKDWSAEQERYELADAGAGTLAYRQKAAMEDGQPAHWLCPTCYEAAKKSYLQPEHHPGLTESLNCPSCHTRLITRGRPENVLAPGGPRRR